MNSAKLVFERLAELHSAGTACVCVTLAGAKGSVPQEEGAKMVVTEAGNDCGTVGGGRVEQAAVQHALALLACRDAPAFELIEWNLQKDIGMTCGGVVTFAFECFRPASWQIAIFGAGHVAQALVRVLVPLDCRITVFDSRVSFLDLLPKCLNVATVCADSLEDAVPEIPEGAFVALMTQGHRTDLPVLGRILQTRSFPYLAVIGSAAKAAVLRKELREAGVSGDLDSAFRCPIGLPLGKDTPEEIAISIAAEMLQMRG